MLPGYYSPKTMGLLDPATSDGRVIFFLPWESKYTLFPPPHLECMVPSMSLALTLVYIHGLLNHVCIRIVRDHLIP